MADRIIATVVALSLSVGLGACSSDQTSRDRPYARKATDAEMSGVADRIAARRAAGVAERNHHVTPPRVTPGGSPQRLPRPLLVRSH